MGNAIVFAVVGVLFALVVAKLVKNRREGKTSCGCGCGTCGGHCSCENR